MTSEHITNDEFKPACPRCRNVDFIAVSTSVQRADSTVAMIICADRDCQTIVGVLPYKAVWEDK